MVSLSTKRRGVAVVAVLTLGLLFGIALLMMRDALPIAETNFSSTGPTLSMTLYTYETNTDSYFDFVNTADGKIVSKYQISNPGYNGGYSESTSVALDENLGQLFCLCLSGDAEFWHGKVYDFTVNGVSVQDEWVFPEMSSYERSYYACWKFGLESEKLVDKGPGQACSLWLAAWMSISTLNEENANTIDDFVFVNTAKAKAVAEYEVSQPGRLKGETKRITLPMNERFGQLFCLCSTGEDAWKGEVTGLNIGGRSFSGVVTSVKLSKNDPGYYPCWRFGIEWGPESDKLVDKGHSQDCSVATTEVAFTIHTRSVAYADTPDDFNLVNTANGVAIGQYKMSQPGPIKGGSKTVSLTLNEELGELFCLCTTGDDAWEGEVTEFYIGGVSFPVRANSLKLSMDDAGYYPCWRFGIESENLVDKGHSESCS